MVFCPPCLLHCFSGILANIFEAIIPRGSSVRCRRLYSPQGEECSGSVHGSCVSIPYQIPYTIFHSYIARPLIRKRRGGRTVTDPVVEYCNTLIANVFLVRSSDLADQSSPRGHCFSLVFRPSQLAATDTLASSDVRIRNILLC